MIFSIYRFSFFVQRRSPKSSGHNCYGILDDSCILCLCSVEDVRWHDVRWHLVLRKPLFCATRLHCLLNTKLFRKRPSLPMCQPHFLVLRVKGSKKASPQNDNKYHKQASQIVKIMNSACLGKSQRLLWELLSRFQHLGMPQRCPMDARRGQSTKQFARSSFVP